MCFPRGLVKQTCWAYLPAPDHPQSKFRDSLSSEYSTYNPAHLRDVAPSSLAAEQRSTAASIEEQVLALGHILDVDLRAAAGLCKNAVVVPFGQQTLSLSRTTASSKVKRDRRRGGRGGGIKLTSLESATAGSTAG